MTHGSSTCLTRRRTSLRKHARGSASGCLLCLLFLGDTMTAMTARAPAAPAPSPATADVQGDAAIREVRAADLELMMLRHRMAVGQRPFNFLAWEEQRQTTARAARRARQAARSN